MKKQDRNQSVSQFLDYLAHELRTPLNVVMGLTQFVLNSELKASQKKQIELIMKSSNELLKSVNDILDFSKLSSSKLEIHHAEFDLFYMIQTAFVSMLDKGNLKNIKVHYDIHPDIPTKLIGDPGRLRQIILNLIENAIKFTAKGQVSLNIFVENTCKEFIQLHFVIKDSGQPIPGDSFDSTFNPFASESYEVLLKYGSSGMRVTIAKCLIDLLGGKMWMNADCQEGNEYHFIMNFMHPDQKKQQESIKEFDLANIKVLILDDQTMNLEKLSKTFAHHGMITREVSDYDTALKEIQMSIKTDNPFRLIVIDTKKTETDAFAIAKRFQEIENVSSIPVLLLTFAGVRGDAVKCFETGIDGYLIKPLLIRDMLLAVQAILFYTELKKPFDLITRHFIYELIPKLSILLVDDDLSTHKMIQFYFEEEGHHVISAVNGIEALKKLKEYTFDLILMDIQMPEMNGIQTTMEIRKHKIYENLPIMALTAHAKPTDKTRCLEAGMNDYLSKPVNLEQLAEKVFNLLEKKRKKNG